jgi:probable phosphoglycerate mutase
MIVAFLRHGSTAWNDEARMQGRRDIPLSDRGRAEVESWRTAGRLDRLVRSGTPWYSSPLRRAIETAEILSGARPRCDAALIEMDWGEWEGLRLSELRDRYGAEFARNEAAGLDFQPDGGESPRQVRVRVVRWLAATALAHDSIVAVTHKGVLRAVLSAATGWDMTVKPPVKLHGGALHRFEVDAGGRIEMLEANASLVEK